MSKAIARANAVNVEEIEVDEGNSGQTDADAKPMTIKAVPVRTREMMAKMARMRGQQMGPWLAEAVEILAGIQMGSQHPDAPKPIAAVTLPHHGVRLPENAPGNPGQMSPDQLAAIMSSAAALGSSEGVTKGFRRMAMGMATDMIREARGLPAPARRAPPVRLHGSKTPGKTKAISGQTEAA